MSPRVPLVIAVVLATLLVGAGSASAGTLSLDGTTLLYTAAPGETNALAVTQTQTELIFDETVPGVSADPGPGCDPGPDPGTASCPFAGLRSVRVELGDGNDRFTNPIGFLPATIDAGSGDDQVNGSAMPETLEGGDGTDELNGADGNDTVLGGPGNDAVGGQPGDDTVDGGVGDDIVSGGAGDDTEQGGAGADQVFGGDGDDTLRGGDGDDIVESLDTGMAGNDQVEGNAGNDVLGAGTAANGADSMAGGAGRDRADYSRRGVGVVVTLDGNPDDGEPGERDNVTVETEDVTGGGQADALGGSAAANALDGGGGADRLDGNGGDDVLNGGGDGAGDLLDGGDGNDALAGGPGPDAADGGNGSDTVSGGDGLDTVGGGEGDDLVTGGEEADAVGGGPGNDQVMGAGPGTVGADGDDLLDGGSGLDGLEGGPGDDDIDGGVDADVLSGGEGRDRAIYASVVGGAVRVSLDGVADDGPFGAAPDNVLVDVEGIAGSPQQDDLVGSDVGNVLLGGGGEDFVDGDRGPDELLGGDAGDVVRARDGTTDQIDCGAQPDLVIADRNERTTGCEHVAFAGRPPTNGRTVLVEPAPGAPGTPAMNVLDMERHVPLQEQVNVPVDTNVDATAGAVTVSAFAGRRRTRAKGTFSAQIRRSRRAGSGVISAFAVRQRRARSARRGGIVDIVLRGGSFASCPRTRGTRSDAGTAQRRRSRSVRRRLFGNARGRFRSRGRFSSATVRGTQWLVEDRCDGTLTSVRKGSVRVFDRVRRRSVTLRAGDSFLATPRGVRPILRRASRRRGR